MKLTHKRALALAMSAALALGTLTPAMAAGELSPVCDESYYATLDYYGGLKDASVVKSYRTNGRSTLTDYGTYDEVINLTDDRAPTMADGAVTFDLGEDAPDRFYFEGKTEQPFRDLPWTISLSYKLNGAPALAEDLAGSTGLVEIDLDVIPNPSASEYARNNLVLTAATAFNADDITSLEAPGAQVQLVGNLRAVLFMVMPGEEQHFAIRVGSEDFSFSGLVLLAVPATLQQLDQIADLREAKEKTEESYDAINDSLDVILNSLDGMSGSLNATANGLDQLNRARGTISAGKGGVYNSVDAALSASGSLTNSMKPVNGHLDSASQALTDTTSTLTALTDNAMALKPELECARSAIQSIQSDTKKLKDLAGSLESYNKSASQISGDLQSDCEDMGDALEDLESSLSRLESALRSASGVSKVDPSDLTDSTKVNVGGTQMTVTELLSKISAAKKLEAAYEAKVKELSAASGASEDVIRAQLPFHTFLVGYFTGQGLSPEAADAQATGIEQLIAFTQTQDYQDLMSTLDSVNSGVDGVNDKIGEINGLITGLTKPTARVVEDLQRLTVFLGDDGLSGDLAKLSKLASDLLKDLKEHEGDASTLLTHLDELGDLAGRVTRNADTALDLVKQLDDTLGAYEPKAQQALSDAQDLVTAASDSLSALTGAAQQTESLLKASGGDLDAGTRQALSGLAEALRRSTTGLNETDTIRNAKDTITGLIDDEWESHTGGDNNLLLMDAAARPQSMTDARNQDVNSVQFILRTQEIKAGEEPDEETAPARHSDNGTLWTRIKAMFRDFWNAITGLFH